MELCNNSDYDHNNYPGVILEADSNLVGTINQNWFYGMMANTCDSVAWNVISSNIEVSTQVNFIAYPTILNCDNNPEFCFESDTVSFFMPINVETVSNYDKILHPKKYRLHQNYPNPFNPATSIQYELPKESFVNVYISNLKGQLIRKLVSHNQTAGYKSIKWNGVDDKNKVISAGLYFYTIQAGDYSQTKKMILLK